MIIINPFSHLYQSLVAIFAFQNKAINKDVKRAENQLISTFFCVAMINILLDSTLLPLGEPW